MNVRSTSVTENLLDDKELHPHSLVKLESEKVINGKSEHRTSSQSPKLSLQNLIVHSSDKACGVEYDNQRESESIYEPVESYPSQSNIYYNNDYQVAGEVSNNWAYDLSARTSLASRTKTETIDYSLQYQNSASNSDTNLNFRNPYNYTNGGAMKGNLMTLSQFNDFLSPPSSVSSSSGYEISDNNNNSFITIEQALNLSTIDDVIREELKNENCFLVEDTSVGSYTTLTNASAAAPLDLYHIQDFQRNYSGAHNHSTSSGGDSRSPDGYGNDEYENGGFTQLTNLTTRSTNGIYASSPNTVGDHNIMTYDSTHVLSPTR